MATIVADSKGATVHLTSKNEQSCNTILVDNQKVEAVDISNKLSMICKIYVQSFCLARLTGNWIISEGDPANILHGQQFAFNL